MRVSSSNYWTARNLPASRRGLGDVPRPSDHVPEFPELETRFWRAYGIQTAAALMTGAVGLLGWVFYARSLTVLGMGAILYYACFVLAMCAGVCLPIHYYRRFKMIQSFGLPDDDPDR
ncbi:MAG: hypothetical protein AAFX94_18035 [Myxococcota bacterium]